MRGERRMSRVEKEKRRKEERGREHKRIMNAEKKKENRRGRDKGG